MGVPSFGHIVFCFAKEIYCKKGGFLINRGSFLIYEIKSIVISFNLDLSNGSTIFFLKIPFSIRKPPSSFINFFQLLSFLYCFHFFRSTCNLFLVGGIDISLFLIGSQNLSIESSSGKSFR